MKIVMICLGVLFIVAVLGMSLLGYKLYRHELNQEKRIKDLQAYVQRMEAGNDEDAGRFIKACVDAVGGGINLLVLGNSITKHGLNHEYWWNEIGMAASEASKDYYHRLVAALTEQYEDVNAYALNYSQWELNGHDRNQTFSIIDPFLCEQLDYIILQLGENIADSSTFQTDCEALLIHIRDKCPNTAIIMVGNFWGNKNMAEKIKKKVAEDYGISYVSLEDLWDKEEFQAGMGTIVFDGNGKQHVIKHSGVAIHPGDLGMQAIAEKIVDCLVGGE